MSAARRHAATVLPVFLLLCAPKLALPQTASAQQLSTPAASNPAAISITLDEAIQRAQQNEPGYVAATGDARIASLDRAIARAALLPSVAAHNQLLYTQPNGSRNLAGQSSAGQPSPKFIANNAVHEYATQAIVTETLGIAQIADAGRAAAFAAQAAAQQQIARRGLIATVVDFYFSAAAAGQKSQLTQRALTEAQNFFELTSKLEAGREVAHADTVKAQLQLQQRQRDVKDAGLAQEKATLDLAVLLFSDPLTPYTLADSDAAAPMLPDMDTVRAAAQRNNPDLGSALAAMHVAEQEVLVSRAAYLPDLAMNFSYGIDAPEYALNGPVNVRNLGYAASATVDLPVWDWLSTHHRVQQSEIRRSQAQTSLTYVQKRLVAQLQELYNEATVANAELASLQASGATAAESLRLIKLRYSAGEATVLEVVDAQNAMITVETQLADGMTRYRVALANLQTLTGVL